MPALVQLKCRESFYKSIAGIRLQGKVGIFVDGRLTAQDTGEIQLANYGISGIPVFQVSRYASYGLYHGQDVTAALDFMPDFKEEAFAAFLEKRAERHPERTMDVFFTEMCIRDRGYHDQGKRYHGKTARCEKEKDTEIRRGGSGAVFPV